MGKKESTVNQGHFSTSADQSTPWEANRHGQPLLGQFLCRAHADLEACLGQRTAAERLTFIEGRWAKTFLVLLIKHLKTPTITTKTDFGIQTPWGVGKSFLFRNNRKYLGLCNSFPRRNARMPLYIFCFVDPMVPWKRARWLDNVYEMTSIQTSNPNGACFSHQCVSFSDFGPPETWHSHRRKPPLPPVALFFWVKKTERQKETLPCRIFWTSTSMCLRLWWKHSHEELLLVGRFRHQPTRLRGYGEFPDEPYRLYANGCVQLGRWLWRGLSDAWRKNSFAWCLGCWCRCHVFTQMVNKC